MHRNIVVLGAAGLFSVCAGTAHAGSVFTNIIDPANPTFTQALGVNDANTIVGYGNATIFNGFVVTPPPTNPANFTRENFPGQTGGTQVTGISGAGTTVGFSVSGAGINNGFVKNGGTFTAIDNPGTAFNQILGINQAGTLAAGYDSVADATGATGQQAYLVSGGPSFTTPVFTNLNPLLPANSNSQATGVNNSGEVVGFYELNNGSGNFSGFIDVGGKITSFNVSGAASTQVLGVNNFGQFVGDYVDSSNVMHGFFDSNGNVITLDPNGSVGTTANGVNDSENVVGFYLDANENTIGFETNVAEPATLLMLASALTSLAFVRLSTRKPR